MSFSIRRFLTCLAPLALLAIPAASFAQATTVTPTFNCTLTVPASPLTPAGLTTPYILSPTTANDSCDETSGNSAVFVQAVIFDAGKTLCGNQLCVYNPLVINQGTTPAVPPLPLPGASTANPAGVLPNDAIVGLWFGGDGGNITLQGPPPAVSPGSVASVSTLDPSCTTTNLGQFAYCNAGPFFTAVNAAISGGSLTVPPIGKSPLDNQVCPTSRSFSIVDQDQSDNQTTWYLFSGSQMAQYNAANLTALPGAMVMQNPSDEWLVSEYVDKALQCTPWTIPDLTNPGVSVPTMVTNELQAAKYQAAPVALVPLGDPFTQNPPQSGVTSLVNVNLYRVGVDQPQAATAAQANTATYCTNLRSTGAQKLIADQNIFKSRPSPLPVGDSLYTTLAARMQGSYVMLNCQALINQPNPVTIIATDPNTGLVTQVSIKASSSAAQ